MGPEVPEKILSVETRLLSLPLRRPLAASHGTVNSRELTVLRIETESWIGWGECAALPEATYSAESASDSYDYLSEVVAPALLGRSVTEATQTADSLFADSLFNGRPMARAAVEMASIDAELKRRGTALADWLGATRSVVPAGATLGFGNPDQLADWATALITDGYRRIKLKIKPGNDTVSVGAVLEQLGRLDVDLEAVEIHVDANGSYGVDQTDTLLRLAEMGVRAIEQPFAPADLDSATTLVKALADRRLPVPVVADEAVTSLESATGLSTAKAATAIAIKPSRLGGLVPARRLLKTSSELGLGCAAGGMIESGLGRHCLAAFAALPECNLIGDLSPAKQWMTLDPWPDITMGADGLISVPTAPGVAPPPDIEVLDQLTEHRSVSS